MASAFVWESFGSGKKAANKNKSEFLKLGAGTYQVRLLGSPIKFHKFIVKQSDGRYTSAICNDPSNNPVTNNHEMTATERYAINIIDRADGQLKILEAGVSVFEKFKEFFQATGQNPGAQNGADFKITVTGANKTKRYETKFVKKTPLTDSEIKMVKERGGLIDLEKIYQPTPDDELENKLFNTSAGENTQSNETSVKAEKVAVSNLGIEENTDDVVEDDAVGDDLPF
jgi:hypothetical protein